MSLIELSVIAVGLSADAFSVSVCEGLASPRLNPRLGLKCGAYFGFFQALMPIIGYFLGIHFRQYITRIDHWIAFALLGYIGLHMVKESLSPEACDCGCEAAQRSEKAMLLLAIATSIDALAVGITFSFLQVQIVPAAALIGLFTLVLSFAGVMVGHFFGRMLQKRAELLGGIILIIMAFKILSDHLRGLA